MNIIESCVYTNLCWNVYAIKSLSKGPRFFSLKNQNIVLSALNEKKSKKMLFTYFLAVKHNKVYNKIKKKSIGIKYSPNI